MEQNTDTKTKHRSSESALNNLVSRGTSVTNKQAALIDKCDGITVLDPATAPVFVSKNGQSPVERDCKEPLIHRVYSGMVTLEVPLSAKDTDTEGMLTVYADTSNSMPSIGVIEVVDG